MNNNSPDLTPTAGPGRALTLLPRPNPDIDTALLQIRGRKSEYERYARYYEGDHPLIFATEKFRSAFGSLFRTLAFNLCPTVIDTLADRMALTGFTLEDDDAADPSPEPGPGASGEQPENPANEGTAADKDDPAEAAWEIWEYNRMDRRQGEVYQEAFKSGDAYVIVWPDKTGQPRIIPQPADLMAVTYDPEDPGVIQWAAKCWLQDGRTYLTLYYPDRIEKYVTRQSNNAAGTPGNTHTQTPPPAELRAGDFEPRLVRGEAWPLDNPYGAVPVFHFSNNAGVGRMGKSELKDVIPLQDALNKSMADMLVAMEFVAYPQRYATGIEVENDDITGLPVQPFKPGADRLWVTANDKAQFGQFNIGDMTQYLNVQKEIQFNIAKITRTPLHYMMLLGAPPSGEALKTLEAPFVKKVLDREVAFGDTWEDVMTLALRIQSGTSDVVRLQAEWVDPAPQSQLEKADVMIQWKALDVPQEAIWEELGFPDETIQEWLAQKAANAATMQAQMAQQPGQQAPGMGNMGDMANMKAQMPPMPAENLAQNVRIPPPKLGA